MAIKLTRKQDMYNRIINDLIIQFTAGGDRFDSDDINAFIEVEGLDREIIYNRLKELQVKIDKESEKDFGNSILPDDFFRSMVYSWLFKPFDDFVHPVCKGWKINYVKPDGNLLSSDLWFDSVSSCHNGIIMVQKDGKYNFLKSDGMLLSRDWFDRISMFFEGQAVVERDGRSWFVDRNNTSLTGGLTFKKASSFNNGMAIVTDDNDMQSYVNLRGEVKGKALELKPFRGESAFASWFEDSWYLVNKEFNIMNVHDFQEVKGTDVPEIYIVGKDIEGRRLYNLLKESGDFLLPGWVSEICELRTGLRTHSGFMIDGKHDISVDRSRVFSIDPNCKEYLSKCPKLKGTGKKVDCQLKR